jgi:hypothetical protein
MSSDFAFWKHVEGDPGQLFDQLSAGNTASLRESEDVWRFRTALLRRWPDLRAILEPDDSEPAADKYKYVLLNLPLKFLGRLDDIIDLSKQYGLDGYSGVGEAPLS